MMYLGNTFSEIYAPQNLGDVAKFTWFGMLYICAKLHGFTTKCTIHSYLVIFSCWTTYVMFLIGYYIVHAKIVNRFLRQCLLSDHYRGVSVVRRSVHFTILIVMSGVIKCRYLSPYPPVDIEHVCDDNK